VYAGAPCLWGIGKPFEGPRFACPTDGLGLFRRNCTSLNGVLYLVWTQTEPTLSVVLNMPTFVQTLGLATIQVVTELQLILYGALPAPVNLFFLPSLTHVTGALTIQEVQSTVRGPLSIPYHFFSLHMSGTVGAVTVPACPARIQCW
jgi:hypothetical protein